MGIEYFLQVGDFAAKGGPSHEQGERNVISVADQNIFLAEKLLVNLNLLSIKSRSSFWERKNVIKTYFG